MLRLKACTLIVCMLLVQSFKKVGTSSQTLLQAQTRPHGQCTVHARFLRQKIRSRTIARLLKSAHKTLKNTDRIKRRIQREVDIQPIMKHLPSPEFSRNSEKCLFGVTRIKRSGLIQIWRRGGGSVTAVVTGEQDREWNGQRLDSSCHDNLSQSTPTAKTGARRSKMLCNPDISYELTL